jgi:hypothetical protein
MLAQALGLAVTAAISPTALLVTAVFLGSASPRRTVVFYLVGAVAMTGVMAALCYVVLRAGHLYKPSEHSARYGLRLGLGLLCLLAAGYLFRRGPRAPDPARQGKSLVGRMVARPGNKTALIVGVVLYSPSITFVAAVQVVATSDVSVAVAVSTMLLIVAITVAFIWLPLVLYLFAPDRTGKTLARFNGWLRAHGYILAVVAVTIAGTYLTINGILGLTGVV